MRRTETVGAASRNEQDMLESATGVKPNLRLSRQIILTDALDGLVVRTPESQHWSRRRGSVLESADEQSSVGSILAAFSV
jgi:hypothetical protein